MKNPNTTRFYLHISHVQEYDDCYRGFYGWIAYLREFHPIDKGWCDHMRWLLTRNATSFKLILFKILNHYNCFNNKQNKAHAKLQILNEMVHFLITFKILAKKNHNLHQTSRTLFSICHAIDTLRPEWFKAYPFLNRTHQFLSPSFNCPASSCTWHSGLAVANVSSRRLKGPGRWLSRAEPYRDAQTHKCSLSARSLTINNQGSMKPGTNMMKTDGIHVNHDVWIFMLTGRVPLTHAFLPFSLACKNRRRAVNDCCPL